MVFHLYRHAKNFVQPKYEAVSGYIIFNVRPGVFHFLQNEYVFASQPLGGKLNNM